MSTDATTGKEPAPRIVRIGHVVAPWLAAAATIGTSLAAGPQHAWVPFGATIAPETWQQPLTTVSLTSLQLQVRLASVLPQSDDVSSALLIAAALGGLSSGGLVVLLRRAGLGASHAWLLALVASAAPLAQWQSSSPLGRVPLTLASLALLAVVTSSRLRWPGPVWRRGRVASALGLLAAVVSIAVASDGPMPLLRLIRGEVGLIGLVLLTGHLIARQRPSSLGLVAGGSVLLLAIGAGLPAPDRLALVLPWLWWLVAAALASILSERPVHVTRWATAGLACWLAIHAAQVPWGARRQAAAAARTWADGIAGLADDARPLARDDSAAGQLVAAIVEGRHGRGALIDEERLRGEADAGRTPLVVDALTRHRWRLAGIGFAAPATHAGVPLHRLLDAFPAGTVVAVAISRDAAARLTRDDWQALARIGIRSADAGQPRAHVVVGLTRVRAAGLHVADPQHAHLAVQPGDPIGRLAARAPIDARLEAAVSAVTLTLRGRTLHAGPGLIAAFWTTRGELLAWRNGATPGRLHGGLLGDVPVVSEAIATLPCVALTPGHRTDITEAARAGGLGLVTTAPGTLDVAVHRPEGTAAGAFAWLDATPTGATLQTLADRAHVEISAPTAAGLAMRRRVTQATATATRPLTVCGAWPVAEAFDPAALALRVDMGPGDEVYLSDGWHDRERVGVSHFRWMAARQAGWMVALSNAAPLDLVVDAQTVDAPQPGDVIGLTVNDHTLPPQRVETQRAAYRWAVPVDAWHRGLNTIVIEAPRTLRPADRQTGADGRTLGLAVHGWSLSAAEPR